MKRLSILSMAVASALFSGCGGGSTMTQTPPHVSTWTWVSGAKAPDQAGVYGTQGTASPSNMPGSRQFAVSWRDRAGHFWLFGGNGFDSTGIGTQGDLNDLWKFDGTNWTWVSGSQIGNGIGTYGTLGTASASNLASSRVGAVSWIDANGNLWFFGGFGKDPTDANTSANLNDLWRFTP